ncbi:MAG TPA: hypothetical protein VHJ38_15260 [Nitrososphaeraceae archaeon]|nr:hypothetical protein [Nitrososphaeraceae archaeon]
MLTNAKNGLQKLENINPLDWYRWSFGQSKIKKALGIMLILTLIAFIVSRLILLELSIFSRPNISSFQKRQRKKITKRILVHG